MSEWTTMEQDQDQIMMVDAQDQVLGKIGKIAAHQGKGELHRAITVALFNDQDQILIAQRSATKPLWPEWWDLSCSTHPWYPDETGGDAALRRLPFELGVDVDQLAGMTDIFSYEYHAVYSREWSENEFNHLIVGRYQGPIEINPAEVAQYKWINFSELEKMVEQDDFFAPWVSYTVAPLKAYVRS